MSARIHRQPASDSRPTLPTAVGAVEFCAADQRAELHLDLDDATLAALACRAYYRRSWFSALAFLARRRSTAVTR